MLWILEYIFYSILIIFLIDKIYYFIQNNNGCSNPGERIVNNTTNNFKKDIPIQKMTFEDISKNDMENELNKVFQNNSYQENMYEINNDVISNNILKIETSNISELPTTM